MSKNFNPSNAPSKNMPRIASITKKKYGNKAVIITILPEVLTPFFTII